MTPETITALVVAVLGGGGLGAWLTRWLAFRKSREESVDGRFVVLLDKYEADAAVLRSQVAALMQAQANADARALKAEDAADRLRRQYAKLQQRLRDQKADSDKKIAGLERELVDARGETAMLRQLLSEHGITDPTYPRDPAAQGDAEPVAESG